MAESWVTAEMPGSQGERPPAEFGRAFARGTLALVCEGMNEKVRNIFRSALSLVLVAALALGMSACSSSASQTGGGSSSDVSASGVAEDGTYTSKDEVALYIHTYGHLPSNFISKTKAKKAGWVSSEGNLDEVCPGKSIGGSTFYNDDGLLPEADGRTWKECDINYTGGFRGSERIVFSNDGLIYYTNDHYQTFEQLY